MPTQSVVQTWGPSQLDGSGSEGVSSSASIRRRVRRQGPGPPHRYQPGSHVRKQRPVMMVHRERNAIGALAPARHGPLKTGFAKDGRIRVDCSSSMAGRTSSMTREPCRLDVSLLYQLVPHSLSRHDVTRIRPAAGTSRRVDAGIVLMEQLMNKAASTLVRPVREPGLNAPEQRAGGPVGPNGHTSCIRPAALGKVGFAAPTCGWRRRSARRSRTARKFEGSALRRACLRRSNRVRRAVGS